MANVVYAIDVPYFYSGLSHSFITKARLLDTHFLFK